MESNLSPEFIGFLKNMPNGPRVCSGVYVEITECSKCPLRSECLFGVASAENIKRGYRKLPSSMCAFRNGFHVYKSMAMIGKAR